MLGDSTLTETAHDFALLLGADFVRWLHDGTRMPLDTGATLESNGVVGRFYPNHRNFTIADANETRVYHRFIGARNISENFEGIRALRDLGLRAAIEREVAATCGGRPRELWLESSYHDPEAHVFHGHSQPLKPDFDAAVDATLPWLEALAPRRQFHSRHSAGNYALNRLIPYWRSKLSTRNASWRFVSHVDAWACEPPSHRIPQHTGAIFRGYTDRDFPQPGYCCFYLSMLRTLCALTRCAVPCGENSTDVLGSSQNNVL
jgi:hypothetical protein